jgi:hypothetical protein
LSSPRFDASATISLTLRVAVEGSLVVVFGLRIVQLAILDGKALRDLFEERA